MTEEERFELQKEYEAMSDDQIRQVLLNANKEEDPEGYEVLWQEAQKRSAQGKLLKTEQAEAVAGTQAYKENKIAEIDPSAIKMVVAILVLNAIGSLIFFIWERFVGISAEAGQNLLWVFVDITFAVGLWQRKEWARKWIIIRSVIGCITWVAMDISQFNILGAVTQVIYFGGIICLLIKNVPLKLSKGLGTLAILVILLTSSQNIEAILYHKKMLKQVDESGQVSYSSAKYGYSLNAPDNWTIIQRKDFKKIDPTLLDTDGDIAMMMKGGKGYCLVVPEPLPGLGVDYNVEGLRNVFLNDLKNDPSVEIMSNSYVDGYGDTAFEITYSAWVEGFHYNYILLYSIQGKTGMQLFAWTFESESNKLFEDIRSIMKNIKVN